VLQVVRSAAIGTDRSYLDACQRESDQWVGALVDAHYNGAVCVEVEEEASADTLEGRERSLRISRNVLRPIVA